MAEVILIKNKNDKEQIKKYRIWIGPVEQLVHIVLLGMPMVHRLYLSSMGMMPFAIMVFTTGMCIRSVPTWPVMATSGAPFG